VRRRDLRHRRRLLALVVVAIGIRFLWAGLAATL